MLPKPRPIWQRVLLIAIGATLSALNLVSFVRAAGLFPGGFTGLSLLIQECLLRYAGNAYESLWQSFQQRVKDEGMKPRRNRSPSGCRNRATRWTWYTRKRW